MRLRGGGPDGWQSRRRDEPTYHAPFQFWRLAIKDITRFNPMVDHPYCAVKEAHQMTIYFSLSPTLVVVLLRIYTIARSLYPLTWRWR
jgi:hypothetical protein